MNIQTQITNDNHPYYRYMVGPRTKKSLRKIEEMLLAVDRGRMFLYPSTLSRLRQDKTDIEKGHGDIIFILRSAAFCRPIPLIRGRVF